MRRLFSKSVLLLNITNGLSLAAGTALTILIRDPHGLMRTGAFIAAVGGVFVVMQVREEIEMEKRHHPHNVGGSMSLTPLGQKAEQLETEREKRRESALRQARLAMVMAIALWLFAGELLHGFGDVIYHQVAHLGAAISKAQICAGSGCLWYAHTLDFQLFES